MKEGRSRIYTDIIWKVLEGLERVVKKEVRGGWYLYSKNRNKIIIWKIAVAKQRSSDHWKKKKCHTIQMSSDYWVTENWFCPSLVGCNASAWSSFSPKYFAPMVKQMGLTRDVNWDSNIVSLELLWGRSCHSKLFVILYNECITNRGMLFVYKNRYDVNIYRENKK